MQFMGWRAVTLQHPLFDRKRCLWHSRKGGEL